MRKVLASAGLILALNSIACAQRLDVKVVKREDSGRTYRYSTSYSNSSEEATFEVSGATLTLQLPDGRLAIVNCASKFAEHFAGPTGNRRNCRVPLVEEFQAEFHGDSARLVWVVSLDGKKTQSETYKILAVLDRPKGDP